MEPNEAAVAPALARQGLKLCDRYPTFFGPEGLRAGWRVLMFLLVAQALGVLIYVIALRPSFEHGLFAWPPAKLFVLGLWFLLPILGAAAVMAGIERRPVAAYGLPVRDAFDTRFWEGALWGLGFQTLLLVALCLTGSFSFGRLLLHGGETWRWGAGWGVAFVAVGMMQEYLYRGYPLYTLSQAIGFWPAATVLSVLFGLAHLLNPGVNVTFIAGTMLVGLFWSFTVRRTGNLWFAVGLHSGWNWACTFLYNADREAGRLLESSFRGPVWLSGGRAAPEGSVLVFPLIALMWLALAARFPRRAPDEWGG